MTSKEQHQLFWLPFVVVHFLEGFNLGSASFAFQEFQWDFLNKIPCKWVVKEWIIPEYVYGLILHFLFTSTFTGHALVHQIVSTFSFHVI